MPVPKPVVYPLPAEWTKGKLVLEVVAVNASHYAFSVGPEGKRSERRLVMEVGNEGVSWGFTGEFFSFFSFLI